MTNPVTRHALRVTGFFQSLTPKRASGSSSPGSNATGGVSSSGGGGHGGRGRPRPPPGPDDLGKGLQPLQREQLEVSAVSGDLPRPG